MSNFDYQMYHKFFLALTGNPPYAYQQELAKELFQGKSVVLRAPTGSGKTWATLAPFLYSRVTGQASVGVDRVIYALPLRSLASSLYRTTTEKVRNLADQKIAVSNCARNRRYLSSDPMYITLQIGGQQDDPFFEGDVVFTTIDQLLSSYLFSPVSLPERVGNIGAGALIGSLIVFDEVHLLDPERSLATATEMLHRLNDLSQFILMTATLPDSVLDWIVHKLDATSRTLSSQEVLALPSHATKERRFSWVPHCLTADDIVRSHKQRTIAIVNSVRRAQSLYHEVCRSVEELSPAPKILLLHSRFFPEDRRQWESEAEVYFGPEALKSNAILISTQVIEAGIDISCDVLLTELAPLSSLIQRAGRVARYGKPRNEGLFLVFELPTNDKGKFKMGPYRDQVEIIDATRQVIAQSDGPAALDYIKEIKWLNEVHGSSDLAALSHLDSLFAYRKEVLRAMDGLDESACSHLIRDISSVSVVLTDKPESVSFAGRRWPQLLSVPRSSLFQLREACESEQDPSWVMKVPREEVQTCPSGGLAITWTKCANPLEAAWVVAIHPAHATYSPKVGLEIGQRSETVPVPQYSEVPPLPRYSYQREPFAAHARRVVNHGQRIAGRHPNMIEGLSRYYPDLSISNLVDVACATHDTGKLQIPWQAEAHRWQHFCNSRDGVKISINEPLAHTTYDPDRDRANPCLPNFPPHASCGALVIFPYLAEHFPPEIAVTICTAIARHHGAHTKHLSEYQLIPDAFKVLQECLPAKAPTPLILKLNSNRVEAERFADECLLHLSDQDENCWALYSAFVRILRLADQGSFQEKL